MKGVYVVVFDGICNFCSATVHFIAKRDPAGKFMFVPMQSAAARGLIERHYPAGDDLDTFLLIRGDACLVRTEAALAIAAGLSWPWPLCAGFRVVPRVFRDLLYGLFARNRYKLFGRKSHCMIPSTDIRHRFLD